MNAMIPRISTQQQHPQMQHTYHGEVTKGNNWSIDKRPNTVEEIGNFIHKKMKRRVGKCNHSQKATTLTYQARVFGKEGAEH
jgi:hypothetical protein